MKLVLPIPLAPFTLAQIGALAPDLEVVLLDEAGEPQGPVGDAEVLVRWWYSREWLRRMLVAMPQLRWLHTPSAGVDMLLIPELLARRLVVTNTTGSQAPPIAEYAMLAMLSHAKRLPAILAAQRERQWLDNDSFLLGELSGQTLLIVGLGAIGGELARRAAAFDMRVLASRRRPAPAPHVERVVGEGEWRGLLPEADFVVICAPLTERTRRMFDADALRAMKPSAYLINIARGEIIDDQALVAALREGRIAGALLDAFAPEPLPPESPYWTLPNCTVSPHISWSSPRVSERNAAILLENLRRYRAGERLLNVVDQQAGY
jgi:phosphoglycerate dehydrogenase-like enzyme